MPAVLWLSGLTCTEDNFSIKSGAQRYAADLGIALLMPDTSPRGAGVAGEDDDWDLGTGAGFYVDATNAPWSGPYSMYSYVTRDLPEAVFGSLPIDPERISISGHSMGGHGALTVALKNPGRFRSVSAFSPISAPTRCPWGRKAFAAYLGDDESAWAAHDACELVGQRQLDMTILVDQGDADEWLDQLNPDLLRSSCEAAGQSLTLRMQPGYNHGFYFISTFIEEHLNHHARALGAI